MCAPSGPRSGISELREHVDTLIVIENDRLLQVIEKKTSVLESFRLADDVLRQGVQGITDLITVPGLVNLDFADVRTIMRDAGSALMGIGSASGENRAAEAARIAVSSPLLESSIEGATGILLNVTAGADIGLFEVNEAAEVVTAAADANANVIFGAVIDPSMGAEVRVTVIATGFGQQRQRRSRRQERAARRGAGGAGRPRASARPGLRHAGARCSTCPRSCGTARAAPGATRDRAAVSITPRCRRRSAARRCTTATSPSARGWCRSPAGRCRCSTRA